MSAKFCLESMKRRGQLEDLGLDDGIIIKFNILQYDGFRFDSSDLEREAAASFLPHSNNISSGYRKSC
jgi:hypothetical protein